MRKSNGIVKIFMINRMPLVNRFIKKTWMLFASLIILTAVLSSIFRCLTPWAKQYKDEVEQHLSQILGKPVTIQSMQTGWYWFHPVLQLDHLTVNNNQNSLRINKLLVGISLFKSLFYWRIQPGLFYIDGLQVTLTEQGGHWHIRGFSSGSNSIQEINNAQTQLLLAWFTQQTKLILTHVSAQIHFSNGGLIPLSEVNLSVANQGGHYKIKGTATLDQTSNTRLQLLGDVFFELGHPENAKGELYFAAKNWLPAQWQMVVPNTSVHIDGGKGDISLWISMKQGKISDSQAQIKLKRFAWRFLDYQNAPLIQTLDANLAWKPNQNGWQLQANHLKLRVGGVRWPENELLISYNREQASYLLFVKSLIMESLLSQVANWPQEFQPIGQLNPHGVLSDTQLVIKEKRVHYLLTRFEHLDWNAFETIPEVKNLSGALEWQPEEGHLELDSEDTSIKLNAFPTQHLTLLNGAMDWKELSDGLRISIDRLAISKPDLVLSAAGAMDQVTTHSLGHVRLNVDFSAKNIEQWFPFLPKPKGNSKLFPWLQQDMKRIAAASGKITINGLARDFPFDHDEGQFTLISHAHGAELRVSPKWQLIKDMEGYIKVNKRHLNIDIVNADIQGVPVKQMNLRIDDLGSDKENLLVHGIIHGQAQKMVGYVMDSPLKESLSRLNQLSLQGLLLLNLYLEIPLYPENDLTLAKGELTFKENAIAVKYKKNSLPIEDLSGTLAFDQEGITHAALLGTALGYPLQIKMESEKSPHPLTLVTIDGQFPLESIKNRWAIPQLSLVKGTLVFNALFQLSNSPEIKDQLTINTSLQGVAINLPAPLGKNYDITSPIAVTIDFNLDKSMRFKGNFNNLLSMDLLFRDQKGDFAFQSGQIALGSRHALDQKQPGLAIVGNLDGFDLQPWWKIAGQLASEKSKSSVFSVLRIIDVSLNRVLFAHQHFDHLAIKAGIGPNNDWSIHLQQKKIKADLTYNNTANLLSGFIHYLYLDKISSKNRADSSSHLSPGQIPNLNLRVDNFILGGMHLGNLTLKSESSPERMLIKYCHIESPVYQLALDGQWEQKDQINTTKMNVTLHLNDLAKSLERLNITPAVHAGKGDLEFSGGWNGTVLDFSLPSLKGTLYLQLKKGIITHLSPETEEKLGLGKLLSILSLQTIPRRLTLDFSDLSHQGYSFDVFKGNFNLNKGIMNTQDSYIDGPVAYASMKGELDLVRRLYDLNLSISPHITASLPVVATIAGGPIAGVAAWVANKIINQSMQRITAYTYKISGPWDQPVVQQLSIVKK